MCAADGDSAPAATCSLRDRFARPMHTRGGGRGGGGEFAHSEPAGATKAFSSSVALFIYVGAEKQRNSCQPPPAPPLRVWAGSPGSALFHLFIFGPALACTAERRRHAAAAAAFAPNYPSLHKIDAPKRALHGQPYLALQIKLRTRDMCSVH